MSLARSSVAAAALHGRVYVAGGMVGCCDSEMSSNVAAYNPGNRTWTERSPLHEARSAAGSATIDGLLYVVGGRVPGSDVATLEVYTPSTDRWVTKRPMPTPRRWAMVEAVNGLLYVAGGHFDPPDAQPIFRTLEVYNPHTDRWATKAPMLYPRDAAMSSVLLGKIYVAGGERPGDIVTRTLQVYDPSTNRWHLARPMPTRRAYGGGATLHGMMYVVGGIRAPNVLLRSVFAYSPSLDRWSVEPRIPTPRDRLGEVAANHGRLYVAGDWFPCFGCDVPKLEVLTPGIS
jgi:N-acetylneuraminic acid mutarotase